MTPTTTRRWTVEGKTGFDCLKFNEKADIPKLGERDILVKIHAASLNYRDLVIAKGSYIAPQRDGVVPTSDGAGEVSATGSGVTRFKEGDKVVTLFNQGHLSGSLTPAMLHTASGGVRDGALTEYGIFDETALVAMPEYLSWEEGATLSCAGVTAWNSLYGLEGRKLKAGDWVLSQGTGGVSIFAMQFALAAGATVIGTTSSDEKGAILKEMGVHHIINYRNDPNWGQTAKGLTPNQAGVDHIIEIGGPATMAQSLDAIKMDGVIEVVGFVGGLKGPDEPSTLEALMRLAIIRGVMVGSRLQHEEMNRGLESTRLKPVVDKKVFQFEEAREAYQYMWDQKHFGKVVIKIQE